MKAFHRQKGSQFKTDRFYKSTEDGILIAMRKTLIVIIAFITSTILGCVLLLLISMAVGYVLMASYQRNHSGIGAVAGGISETAVIATPILCGIIGTLITLHRIERRSPSSHNISSLP
jgi:hypothetical protein